MIEELTKAVIKKHGPFRFGIDSKDRFVLSLYIRGNRVVEVRSCSLVDGLIKLLIKDKINNLETK